jgi:hypothetical protein
MPRPPAYRTMPVERLDSKLCWRVRWQTLQRGERVNENMPRQVVDETSNHRHISSPPSSVPSIRRVPSRALSMRPCCSCASAHAEADRRATVRKRLRWMQPASQHYTVQSHPASERRTLGVQGRLEQARIQRTNDATEWTARRRSRRMEVSVQVCPMPPTRLRSCPPAYSHCRTNASGRSPEWSSSSACGVRPPTRHHRRSRREWTCEMACGTVAVRGRRRMSWLVAVPSVGGLARLTS